DLKILKEVFGLEPVGYRKANAFWNAYAIADLVAVDDDAESLRAQSKRIRAVYDRLSQEYQSGKTDNDIPLN
ncbi:MAG: nucleoside deaminase, partial [Firmicutes bacterium]|nr:nucleoside deaminase [Bacillota bacterium]